MHSDRMGMFGHRQIGIYHILDVDKIPGLRSVSVNHRPFPVDQIANKDGNDSRVIGIRRLPGTEHIKIA